MIPRDELQQLVEQWRSVAPEYGSRRMCADELAALLAKHEQAPGSTTDTKLSGSVSPTDVDKSPAALPLMARRKWMPGAYAAAQRPNGEWTFFHASAGLEAMRNMGAFRIADHDEHGLPVVPREPGMPAGAKYRYVHMIEPGRSEWMHSNKRATQASLRIENWQRIEDFDEGAQP
jgi:hypothetical protein